MASLQTSLTQLLGIRTPLVVPPMAGVSGGALAAQATNGGAFGFISSGYEPAETLLSELSLARSLLESNISDAEIISIGVGFLAWILDKMPSKEAEGLLLAALNSNVQALWFSFGNNLGKWVQFVRDNTSEGKKPPLIFIQVNSLEEAVYYVNNLKPDVIVAQGIESGGHGSGSAPPLSDLIQSILARFSESPQGPIILAAGGLANGRDIAFQLSLGVSGAVLGTRFLLTPESKYTDAQRKALIAARSEDTVRTMAFDQARGTLDWPEGVDGRGLRNDTVLDFEQGSSLELLQAKFKEGIKNQDRNRFLVWAGTGVGRMARVMPAKDVVQELHLECEQQLSVSN
ncbi:2-nitropropane dioxygenase [Gymnopus androsaceus JB14]|uniref:2-nitropropane dioxygenase n=1 Tax=Gymnopus androsaceus JB14 TaxID=1447944 RepID=A0A6A4HSR7_9AGAR|nr:2-nitropropane dioxygenase [Gymnopus androsaceus JB14]